jgi:uncharacterized protein
MNNNALYPVFLKTEKLRFLIVGGGYVGLEKAESLLKQNPKMAITMVGKEIFEATRTFLKDFPQVVIHEKAFEESDLQNIDLVISATNLRELNADIKALANSHRLLANCADQPELCDFYLCSIVNRGNLKIAISTNGKSPTLAKRLKETFNQYLPEEIDDILNNMELFRSQLKGDFQNKLDVLNKVTQNLAQNPDQLNRVLEEESQLEQTEKALQKAKKSLNRTLSAVGILTLLVGGYFLLQKLNALDDLGLLLSQNNYRFYWMLLTGFGAEVVAGSMGMGYGVICTTILLSMGVEQVAASASIHTAESFTSFAGSASHVKLKNTKKELIKKLAIPASIGAILGAILLYYLGSDNAKVFKPYIKFTVACYTLYLGYTILRNALKKKVETQAETTAPSTTKFTRLGLAGGFIDSFAGGGWGPLVTGTLIKKGFTPRYVVGSSTVSKFILTVCSATTMMFLFDAKEYPWDIVAGLLIGGVIIAPFSARITSLISAKRMFFLAGSLVMILSAYNIIKTLISLL